MRRIFGLSDRKPVTMTADRFAPRFVPPRHTGSAAKA
jgi:hypothetical protein